MNTRYWNLWFIAGFILILSGCTGTSVLYSNVFDKSIQPSSEFRVLYLENRLTSSHDPKGVNGQNRMLASVGYDDLGQLFHERAPIVFSLNGLSAQVEIIKKADFGKQEEQKLTLWAQKNGKTIPVLVLQIVGGSAITNTQYGNSTIYLNMHANLFNPATKKRIWTGQFQNTLSLAMLGKIGFDNKFVDNMLKQILDQMAKDKVINLPKGEAVVPATDNNPSTTASS